MLKQFSFLTLSVLTLNVGLIIGAPPAQAGSAVAEDNAGNLFAYSHPNINQAVGGAMALCLQQGAGGCEVRGRAPNTRGWAAIAKGGGKVNWVYGYNSRSAAIQDALEGCPSSNCQIVLAYFDDSP